MHDILIKHFLYIVSVSDNRNYTKKKKNLMYSLMEAWIWSHSRNESGKTH